MTAAHLRMPLREAAPALFAVHKMRPGTEATFERLYRILLTNGVDEYFSAPLLTRWSRFSGDYQRAVRLLRALRENGRIIQVNPGGHAKKYRWSDEVIHALASERA